MASPTTTTTPLILHDDPENQQSRAGRPVSMVKVISGILVSVLVICSLVAVFYNQSQEPHIAANNDHEPSSDIKFTNPLPNIDLKRVPGKLESNAEVEWQRSAYHFQPDKNFISGTKLIMNKANYNLFINLIYVFKVSLD